MQYKKEEDLLKVIQVFKSFDNKEILNDINIQIQNITRPDVKQGQIVSIIGKSGIGKSVLLNTIAGFVKPDFGDVLISSQMYKKSPSDVSIIRSVFRGATVGMVPQNYILFRHKTVLGNLKSANSDEAIIEQYLHDFDLVKHKDKYPHQLSGGQRQRVSIIQQILTGNKIILLDEPFSGLDIITINKVTSTLTKLTSNDELLTFIIVSHDLHNSLAISDYAYILAKPLEDKGATIVKEYDLLAMGLAYDPAVKSKPEFNNLVQEIITKL